MGTSASGAATARTRTFAAAAAAFMLALGLAPMAFAAEESVAGPLAGPGYEGDAQSASADPDLPSAADGSTLASTLAGPTASIVSADVALDAADPIVGSFTADGLTFAVGLDGLSLVAASPDAVSDGTIAIPAAVDYNGTTYDVIAVGPYAFYLSGATSVELPASIVSVDDRAFRSSDVGRVDVASGNPIIASFDGALYDASFNRLLLIPEGRTGSVPIPSEAEVVEASKFSHCSLVDAISVDGDGAAFLSWDGLLYDASGTTLLRVPAGATEITIRDGCTTIAAGAMEGCAKLERINAPASVTSISPDVFQSVPTVALPAQMAVQDEASSDVASGLLGQAKESADFIPQLTAMVALSSADDDLLEVDPSSAEVTLPEKANAACWQAEGFSLNSAPSEARLAAASAAYAITSKTVASGTPGMKVNEYWSNRSTPGSFTGEMLADFVYKKTYDGAASTAYGCNRVTYLSAQRVLIVKSGTADGPWEHAGGWDLWCLTDDFKAKGDGNVDRVESTHHAFEDFKDKWVDLVDGEVFTLYCDYPLSSSWSDIATQPLRIVEAAEAAMEVSLYWTGSQSNALSKLIWKTAAPAITIHDGGSRIMYSSSHHALVIKGADSGDDPWVCKTNWCLYSLTERFDSTMDGLVGYVKSTHHAFEDFKDRWVDLVPGERFTLYSSFDLGFDTSSEPGDADYPGDEKPDQTIASDQLGAGEQVSIEDPKRPGYVFEGWVIPNADGTEAVDQDLVYRGDDGKWYVDASKLPDYAGDDGKVELTARWTSVISVDVPSSVTFYADLVTQGQESREGATEGAFGQNKVANQSQVDLRVVGLDSSAVKTTDSTLGVDSVLKKADAATPSTSAQKLLSLYPSTKQWTADDLKDPDAVGGTKATTAVDFDLDDILLEKSFKADDFTIAAGDTLNMGYRLNLFETGQQLDYDKLATLEEGQSASIANVSYTFAADYGPVFWTTDDDGSTLELAAIKADAEAIATGDAATTAKYTAWMNSDHRFHVKWYDQGVAEADNPTKATVYDVRIIGLNHDDRSDGTGKAGITFQFVNGLNDVYPMSMSKTNAGGWGASDMMANLNAGQVWGQLPAAFRSALVEVDKRYYAGPASLSATLQSASSYCFLPSFTEISAKNFPSGWSKLSSEGSLYAWWKLQDINAQANNEAAKKGRQSAPEEPCSWYLRSAYPTQRNNYVYVNTPGQTWDGSNYDASLPLLVSPCFCL